VLLRDVRERDEKSVKTCVELRGFAPIGVLE